MTSRTNSTSIIVMRMMSRPKWLGALFESGGRRPWQAGCRRSRPARYPARCGTSAPCAVPLITEVPMKHGVAGREDVRPLRAILPGSSPPGRVRPVSSAWLTKKSLASSNRPSHGIRSPAARHATSPGPSPPGGSPGACHPAAPGRAPPPTAADAPPPVRPDIPARNPG